MRNARELFFRWVLPVFFATAGLIAINLVWFIPTLRTIRVSASTLALETAERVHAEINFYLQTGLDNLVSASDELALEPDRANIILARVLKTNAAFSSIAITDRTGKELLRMERDKAVPKEDLQDHSKDSYFYLALEGSPNFGNLFVSPELEPHASLAAPIRGIDGMEGAIIADFNLRNLVNVVRTYKGEKGHIYVVDQNGFQILHPDIAEVLRRPNFSKRQIIQKVVVDGRPADGLAAEDSYINEAGEAVFAVGLPISVAGLGLFVEQPRAQALAGERQAAVFAIVTVLLGVLIFLVIIGSNMRLRSLNNQLREFLLELDRVGKLLVRRDRELTLANMRLEELDLVKSEFVSIAAHQLRTPLTGIRWSYHLLLEETVGPLNAEQKEVVSSALKTALFMIELINDLLNVARIEEGKATLHLEEKSIVPLVERVIANLTTPASEKGIRIVYTPPAQEIPRVPLDEEKVAIVIDNLVDNSIKYTSPGGTITVNILPMEKGGVTVSVHDTGIGIPKDQMHRLFTKFFRADNALFFHTTGSGLGLYLVKNIIEAHRGTLTAESEEGKGTTFTFTLPVAQKKASAA